jgi:hypothetical protein
MCLGDVRKTDNCIVINFFEILFSASRLIVVPRQQKYSSPRTFDSIAGNSATS